MSGKIHLVSPPPFLRVSCFLTTPLFFLICRWQNPELQTLPWPTPQIFNFIVKWVSINPFQGSLAILYAALHPKFGFRSDELQEKHHLPSIGESARIGGQYINRNQSVEALPECYDVLVRSRLWERTLEDIKAKELHLLDGLPGPLTSLLE